jgi:hypothetical protein
MAMTLDGTVLQKLAEWRPGDGRQTLNVADEQAGWAVSLAADRHDDLGTVLWEMTLRRLTPAAKSDLEGWANRVVNRATGLLEPLKVVEIDQQRDEALLRSHQPRRRAQDLFYYEILLKGSRQASVCRYRGSDAGPREQVPFTLTHEALAKLTADLAAD